MRTAILCLLVVGCGAPDNTKSTPDGKQVPLLPYESLVRDYVRRTANDPASVEFTHWGPHITAAELQFTLNVTAIVRVCYRARNDKGAAQFYDQIYVVVPDGQVVTFRAFLGKDTDNTLGDAWKRATLEGLGGHLDAAKIDRDAQEFKRQMDAARP